MSNTTNMNQATKVITGEVRFSYLHIFEKAVSTAAMKNTALAC